VTVDADVLQADAGTRTTAITGGFVALAEAIAKLLERGEMMRSPIRHQIAAVSVGLLEGEPFLDLNYQEDVAADIDFNVVMNDQLEIIELQGTAEAGSFNRTQLNQIMDLAETGIKDLLAAQRQALGDFQL
jgi:ribonuclease PH